MMISSASIDSVNALYIKTRTREKIEHSGGVLCLVSADTQTRRWVSCELETAIAFGKPVVAMASNGIQQPTVSTPIRNRASFYSWDSAFLNTYLTNAKVIPRSNRKACAGDGLSPMFI